MELEVELIGPVGCSDLEDAGSVDFSPPCLERIIIRPGDPLILQDSLALFSVSRRLIK